LAKNSSFGFFSVGFRVGKKPNVLFVGRASFFFFAGGRKKQNKFPSNLHCPVKKLNPFFRYYFITIVSVWSSVFHTCCQHVNKDISGIVRLKQ